MKVLINDSIERRRWNHRIDVEELVPWVLPGHLVFEEEEGLSSMVLGSIILESPALIVITYFTQVPVLPDTFYNPIPGQTRVVHMNIGIKLRLQVRKTKNRHTFHNTQLF